MFTTVGSGVKLMHPGPFLKMKNKKININKSPSSQAANGWALPIMCKISSLTLALGYYKILNYENNNS